jgi:glycosyltransferase involved in cell wall biosynthesis
MRIVFVNYNIYGVGGTVRTTVNVANELTRRGWDVSVISIKRTSDTPTLELDPEVAIDPLLDIRGSRPGRTALNRFARNLNTKTRSRLVHPKDDLYELYSALTDLRLLARLRALRTCVLVTTTPSLNLLAIRHAHPSVIKVGQEHKVFAAHHADLAKQIVDEYGGLDALHCITRENRDEYVRLLEGKTTKIVYIPNGTVVEPASDPGPVERRPVIVTAGHLVPNKGMDRVIAAFARCAERFPRWRLEIYGRGDEERTLSEAILDAGLHNQVFLCGETNQLDQVLRSSSLYALGSHYESFGMVLVEAMAQGLPCVAFDSAGPRALIREGATGHVVSQGDIDQFSDRLVDLMANRERREAFGAAARESVLRYDIRAIGEQWEALLESLVDNHQRRMRRA